MSDTSEKVAMAIRNERRFACVMDCKCDDRQLAEAAIAAMPKLSPVSRQALLLGLEELEAATRVRLTMGGEHVPELAGTLHANLRAVAAARAELENLP